MSEVLETVSAVRLYPIKSGHEATINGELPQRLTIGETGFEHDGVADREWVVIDDTGLFVSQRGWDRQRKAAFVSDKILSLLQVDIQQTYMAITSPRNGHLELDKLSDSVQTSSAFDVFGKTFWGIDEGDEAAHFFSKEVIGRPVRLYRTDFNNLRRLSERYHQPDAVNVMAAADGQPFLWTRQASLDQLHDRAGLRRGMKALKDYRANIESSGDLDPFIEDDALVVSIGGLTGYTTPCVRCPVPNINQDTGDEAGRLSTKLLARTRTGYRAADVGPNGEKPKSNQYFGETLNHRRSSVGLSVGIGDMVQILELSDTPNILGLR